MVTFTLSQSVWEFAKLSAMRASVVSVPMCQSATTFQYTRERAKGVPIMQLGVPMCQGHVNFSTSPTKRRTNLSTIFQNNFSIFEFFNYAQHLQISRIFGQFWKT